MDLTGTPKKFQRLLWKESIQAVKDSIRFTSFETFHKHLQDSLPQNSSYTRKRYTASILKWFFPTRDLNCLPSLLWRHYRDESILRDVMRYQYLSREPVIAEFIRQYLIPLEPGSKLSSSYFKDYVNKTFESPKKDQINYLSLAVRDLGFIRRNRNIPVVQSIPEPKAALIILVHFIFAPTHRTVSLKEIVEHHFWHFLGIRSQDRVKTILKEANARGLIAKYIIADQLEQITTKHTLESMLENRIRL
jgi:hypothetical protein